MAKLKAALVQPPQGGAKLQDIVDQYHLKREERLELAKVVEALEKEEAELKQKIIYRMESEKLSAIGGKLVKVELKTDYKPTVKNWDELYAFIVKNNAFDLLHRRLSDAAVKERWEDAVFVPGIEKFPVPKLSISKVKG